MNTGVKLGVFTLGLMVLFAAAFGAGRLGGPAAEAAPTMTASHHSGHAADVHTASGAGAVGVPGGLQIAQDGYRLDVLTRQLSTVDTQLLQFRIVGPDNEPVTSYATAHEKQLHLVVVRRDLTGFQHVHPTLGNAGVWSVPVKADAPGPYRLFADFQPTGSDKGLVLGADVAASGDYQPQPLAPGGRTANTGEYGVTVDGDLVAGTSAKLTLTVSKAGALVTDLQPYLGALGHLVVLREGDLAYLHVHPQQSTGAGPQIVFNAEVPSDGVYGLFLDFAHDGTVHTAQFVIPTGRGR